MEQVKLKDCLPEILLSSADSSTAIIEYFATCEASEYYLGWGKLE